MSDTVYVYKCDRCGEEVLHSDNLNTGTRVHACKITAQQGTLYYVGTKSEVTGRIERDHGPYCHCDTCRRRYAQTQPIPAAINSDGRYWSAQYDALLEQYDERCREVKDLRKAFDAEREYKARVAEAITELCDKYGDYHD